MGLYYVFLFFHCSAFFSPHLALKMFFLKSFLYTVTEISGYQHFFSFLFSSLASSSDIWSLSVCIEECSILQRYICETLSYHLNANKSLFGCFTCQEVSSCLNGQFLTKISSKDEKADKSLAIQDYFTPDQDLVSAIVFVICAALWLVYHVWTLECLFHSRMHELPILQHFLFGFLCVHQTSCGH